MTERRPTEDQRPSPLASMEARFLRWRSEQAPASLFLVPWGPSHTQIAALFALDEARQAVRAFLDDALNRDQGGYL